MANLLTDKLIITSLLLFCWTVMVFILYQGPRDRTKTMSQHIAARRRTALVFGALMTAMLPLFYILIVTRFVPAFQLSKLFVEIFTFAAACQLVAAWIPDTAGWSSRIHRWCAYTAAVLYPVLLLFLIRSPILPLSGKIFLAMATAYMLVIVSLLGFRVKKIWDNYLPYQVIYIASFHASILAAIYLARF